MSMRSSSPPLILFFKKKSSRRDLNFKFLHDTISNFFNENWRTEKHSFFCFRVGKLLLFFLSSNHRLWLFVLWKILILIPQKKGCFSQDKTAQFSKTPSQVSLWRWGAHFNLSLKKPKIIHPNLTNSSTLNILCQKIPILETNTCWKSSRWIQKFHISNPPLLSDIKVTC